MTETSVPAAHMPCDTIAALWPGGDPAVAPIAPAPRPASLDGKRIGFLWNGMFRGPEIFPILQQALRERFPEVAFIEHEAFGSIFGGSEHAVLQALPARLREHRVDAIICAVGC